VGDGNWPPRLAVLIILSLVLLGCACTRKPAARVILKPDPAVVPVSASGDSSLSVPEASPPVYVPPPPPLEERIDLLVIQARQLVEDGKHFSRGGNMEEARRCFQLALDNIKLSGLGFFENPRLEHAYYTILSEIQAEELRVMMDPSRVKDFEFEEVSPLDEISELNLYSIEVDPLLRELVSQDLLETRFDIPVVLNEKVLKFLNFYQNRGRRIMEEGLRRSGKYLPLFRKTFEKHGIPLDLVYLAHVESLFNPRALSRAKALGLWQFMKGTGQICGLKEDWWVDERMDIVKSTEAAAFYLKSLHTAFNDWHLALAAYNVGPGRIERLLAKHGQLDYWTLAERGYLPRETANYLPSILASLIIFRHPARYGFHVEPGEPLEFDFVELDFQVDLRVVGEMINVPVEELKELNPELKWGITPLLTGGYRLKVPVGAGDIARAELEKLPPHERLRFAHHRVKRGETLGQIARQHGTSVEAIARMNNLKNVNRLQLNQALIVPSPGWRGEPIQARVSERRPSPTASHRVRRGETLSAIAKRYGVTIDNLRRWNNLGPRAHIFPGQQLKLAQQVSPATQIGGVQ
jgi:membrane-bound lytic murein transglycosylase D